MRIQVAITRSTQPCVATSLVLDKAQPKTRPLCWMETSRPSWLCRRDPNQRVAGVYNHALHHFVGAALANPPIMLPLIA